MTTLPKSRTKLEQEVFAKHQQGEAKDILDVITQDNEQKAADAIIELESGAEKSAQEDKMLKTEELERSRKFTRKEYVFKLASLANKMIGAIDFPKNYKHRINYGNEKMSIIITTDTGKQFGRGIIPCGNPDYDLHAVGVLLTQCENTIDMIMKRGAFNESGIVLPK